MSVARGLGRDEALDLIRDIQSGSRAAWQRFVEEYAALIHAVVRRYLAYVGVDDRRDLFVSILERLHGGALSHYDGRSRLSTWLFIFSRSRCLDHLRAVHGRRVLPRWLGRLSPLDQRVFSLYFVNGLGCSAVRELLSQEGTSVSVGELADSLERLDHKLDPRMRRRLANDLFAQSVGSMSGRLLDFLQRLRVECENQLDGSGPEQDLLQQELMHAADQVRGFVDRLPDLERKVIRLRYYQGMTARAASAELGLGGQREIYTIETRAIRQLRAMYGP